jgi:hypothetical protein
LSEDNIARLLGPNLNDSNFYKSGSKFKVKVTGQNQWFVWKGLVTSNMKAPSQMDLKAMTKVKVFKK